MKIIYTGLESSGKSYLMAQKAQQIVRRNARWNRITGLSRPILTNIPFSDGFIKWANKKGVEIRSWRNLDEIIYQSECDVFIDELLKFFDARGWQDLSLDAKHWLSQGAKSGVHVIGSSQDFSMVDKSFRLLTNRVFHVRKIVGSPRPMKTRPPVRFIWGLLFIREVKPESFRGDSASMENIAWGAWTLQMIHKDITQIFDTSAKIKPSEAPPLKKIVRTCPEDGFTKIRYV